MFQGLVQINLALYLTPRKIKVSYIHHKVCHPLCVYTGVCILV